MRHKRERDKSETGTQDKKGTRARQEREAQSVPHGERGCRNTIDYTAILRQYTYNWFPRKRDVHRLAKPQTSVKEKTQAWHRTNTATQCFRDS